MFTASDITAALGTLGVRRDDVLLVHAGMASALHAAGATRVEKMDTVVEGLEAAVPGGTLLMPTFTYSFTAGEPFDVERTPSTVGMLTEHFRARPGVRRIPDPIFSTAARGPLPPALLEPGDVDCFGARSVFAHLHDADGVILFLGVGFEFCTFVHRVEQRLGVGYRYPKPFPGTIVAGGAALAVTATYFVRDLDAGVVSDFSRLEAELDAGGALARVRIERGPRLAAVRARAVDAAAEAGLARDPGFLIAAASGGQAAAAAPAT